ncbi:hypothetical protein B0H19DRAFT_185107 [Mycena capillaripes]|nr:hypothetical protein B0H19DRAFT_185107 [Mycena capillaripes]
MQRYCADTVSNDFTQEVRRLGQRASTPVPTRSQWCSRPPMARGHSVYPGRLLLSARATPPPHSSRRRVGCRPRRRSRANAQSRAALSRPRKMSCARRSGPFAAPPRRVSRPRRTTCSPTVLLTSLDVYQLAAHPQVGVLYFGQFEPSDKRDFDTYINGISATIFDDFTKLETAGVKHILTDDSGNHGGIFSRRISYPDFPAVSVTGSSRARSRSSPLPYFYEYYSDLNYYLLTNNSQFTDPPVPEIVNAVQYAYSQPFFDDIGAVCRPRIRRPRLPHCRGPCRRRAPQPFPINAISP